MRFLGICALAVLALVFVPSAGASHSFSDVPDGHPFHNEIGIFKNTNITSGCTATTFCPENAVLRQAMAAFFARALGLVVRPNESTQKAVPGSRVQFLDDDLSFVGSQDGALELSYNGVQALRLDHGAGGIPNVIGGMSANAVTAGVRGATIAGGGSTDLSENRVTDSHGTIGGGSANLAGNDAGTTSDAGHATVGGGLLNTASAGSATVAGGQNNLAWGQYSTIPGGLLNEAAGNQSFAAGTHASAQHLGSFVWADSQSATASSAGPNTFSVRAAGGISLGTGAPSIPAGRFLNTSTGAHLTTGGVWTNNSDRALKERFSGVDGQRLLRALVGIPIQSWSYKAEPGVRHLGPVAQDFHRAFRLGGSERHIATVDADGVALAAIQALYRENRRLARENREQQARLAKLERQMEALLRAKTG